MLNKFINMKVSYLILFKKMVLNNPIEEITRSKKKFKLSQEDFFKGDWLKELNQVMNFDKVDIVYKGEHLVANFYKKIEENKK